MRSIPPRLPLSLLVLLASSVITVSVARATSSENFIENPSFEACRLELEDGLDALHLAWLEPSHWWPMHSRPDRISQYSWDAVGLRSGPYTVSIDTRSQSIRFTDFEAWGSYVDAAALAGRCVRLSADSRLDALSESTAIELRIHAFQQDQAVSGLCGAASRATSVASEWAAQHLVFEVPEGTTYLLVQLGIAGRGAAWFDNAELIIDRSGEPSSNTWSLESADARCIQTRPTATVVVNDLTPCHSPSPPKPWGIILYAVSDYATAYSPVLDFASAVYANDQLNVLIFEDPQGQGATLYTSTCSEFPVQLTPIRRFGETNSADEATLEQVLAYAKQWFPAERTVLCLYGHGMACWGACTDDTSTGNPRAIVANLLSPPELQAALEAVDGVDAVMYTGPCLMSSLEASYQVQDLVDLYVASEELSGYANWRVSMEPIARTLSESPFIEAEELGRIVIAEIESVFLPMIDQLPHITYLPAIAATSTSELPNLTEAVDAFSLALIDAVDKHPEAVIEARDGAEDVFNGEYVDVYDFASNCQGIPGLADPARRVMETEEAAIIAQMINVVRHPMGHGLNLYFPRLEATTPQLYRQFSFAVSARKYQGYGLTFLEDTHWYEFLEAFFAFADS